MRSCLLLICVCESPHDVYASLRKVQRLVGFLDVLILINVIKAKDLDVRSHLAECVKECGRR